MDLRTGRQIRLSVAVFAACILFTFVLWNDFFNSGKPFDREVAANLVLLMGLLFSVASALFAWSLETRQAYLEAEVRKKGEQLFQKNKETKNAEVAAAAIYQACHLLFSETRGESPLEAVMDLMAKVLYADEGSLMLLDENKNLYIAASRGIPEEIVQSTHLRIGERVAGIAFKNRREYLIVDGLENYPEFQGLQSNPRIRSSMVCPLIARGEVVGVLNLSRTTHKENYTIADLLSASIFAAQLGEALVSNQLHNRLHERMMQLENFQKNIFEILQRAQQPGP